MSGITDPGYSYCMDSSPHKHLSRLDRVWICDPIYFISTCTVHRRRVLANDTALLTCTEVWRNAHPLYGWHVGSYIVMPDHVHFFCTPAQGAKPLAIFVGKWKEWTSKYLHRREGMVLPLWQEGFFDHLLRSSESYTQKWEYVRQNPVRAGLAANPEDWLYQGCLTDLRLDTK